MLTQVNHLITKNCNTLFMFCQYLVYINSANVKVFGILVEVGFTTQPYWSM